jgi:hypothetical protein
MMMKNWLENNIKMGCFCKLPWTAPHVKINQLIPYTNQDLVQIERATQHSSFSMCTQLRFCVRVATRLADLYTCKFDKFRKNSSRNVLLAIDYLPFYIMFFNISVLFRCNTKQECCVALSICTKSWFVYGIS